MKKILYLIYVWRAPGYQSVISFSELFILFNGHYIFIQTYFGSFLHICVCIPINVFLWMVLNCLKATKQLRGGSLRMEDLVDLGATQWSWTRDHKIGNLAPYIGFDPSVSPLVVVCYFVLFDTVGNHLYFLVCHSTKKTFTCLKSTRETLEKDMKHVQS